MFEKAPADQVRLHHKWLKILVIAHLQSDQPKLSSTIIIITAAERHHAAGEKLQEGRKTRSMK